MLHIWMEDIMAHMNAYNLINVIKIWQNHKMHFSFSVSEPFDAYNKKHTIDLTV